VRIHLHRARLPLVRPFRTTHGTKRVQETLLVEARDDGLAGWGEAPASGTWGSTPDDVARRIQAQASRLQALVDEAPEDWWPELMRRLDGDTFAVAAVDTALHDLRARRLGRPLCEVLGAEGRAAPPSSYTLAAEDAAHLSDELRAVPPFPIFKVKIRAEDELPHVARLFGETSATIRVDANEAFTLDEARRALELLEGLGVELVEQPLRRDARHDAARLRDLARVPLIADESCRGPADVEPCAEGFHGVNVKLVKCGGITPAVATIRRARELGLQVMVGCMVETSVAISAAAHLAPLADFVDLDGALLLARDVGHGVAVLPGAIVFAEGAGTGFEPEEVATA
jgi:L-alanine-DL-glutamate epimerase-like enolase superfamily enzyme